MTDNAGGGSDTPLSKSYMPLSCGCIVESVWPDGSKSYQLQLDSIYRAAEPPQGASDAQIKKWKSFQDFGQVKLQRSDALTLMDVGQSLRPDVILSRKV